LIDYERIVDEEGRRLVFFGRFAGLAGMIDTLWALGQRLRHEGLDTPLAAVQPAHRYRDLDHSREAIREAGDCIRTQGLPDVLRPFVCGFAGYGQVSQGAQEVYDLLSVQDVTPEELATLDAAAPHCHKVVFREEHLVEPVDDSAGFGLQEYYDQPDRYRSSFIRHVPHLTALVNGIYWEPKYPPLITREQFAALFANGASPRLRVVGDITCDIDGSLACTTRATTPDNPVYTYDPTTGQTTDGVTGRGPVVLAVDFLPCELPVDASVAFSRAVSPLIPGLAKADFKAGLADSGLPRELARATIVYQGELTEPYHALRHHLDKDPNLDEGCAHE
jgi:alpha-aminoadipic semialdehyde synthase